MNISSINKIRLNLGFPVKENEQEVGIKGRQGFYWGFPDGFDLLPNNWKIYYEIEVGQQHPCTNVLKYWPVLEENKDDKIILIQWLQRKPKSANRWELSKFLGKKMQLDLPFRFKYFFIEFEVDLEATFKQIKAYTFQVTSSKNLF